MNRYWMLALMCCWIGCYGTGEYLSKIWTRQPSVWLAAIIAGVYSLGVIGWLPALLYHGQLSALSTVFSALGIVVAVLLGVIVFGETLQPRQLVGIVLAVLACILTY